MKNNGEKKRKEYTPRRFVLRLGIPLLVVALVTIAVRGYMAWAFAEQNVEDESTVPSASELSHSEAISAKEFEETKRPAAISSLRGSMALLDQRLEEAKSSNEEENREELRGAEKARRSLLDGIERLDTVERKCWEFASNEAYAKLDEYSRVVGRLEGVE